MKAIKKEGLRIPEDIAVVGADNIKWAFYAEPSLTTFSSSLYELSKLGAEKLMALIEGQENSVRIVLKPKLIIRESSGGDVK